MTQAKQAAYDTQMPESSVDPWAAINAFRERLAASGRVFTDSAELIREDRDR